MLKKYSLIIGIISLVIFELNGQYKILSNQGNEVSLAQMVADVKSANVVFFGEQHDDTLAHKAQYDVLSLLHKELNGKVVLSMEMFETDVQYIVDEYLQGHITEQSFTKDARAWDNYNKDYKPMVEFMKLNKGNIIAGNAPRRYVRMVSRNGLNSLNALDKHAKSFLPSLPIDTLSGRYYERFGQIMGGHMTGMSKIYHAQNLWDAAMATNIHKGSKKYKKSTILHLCGKFHCEENLGTVEQLRMINKKLVVKNVIALKVAEFSGLTAQEWKKRGDYIIVTD